MSPLSAVRKKCLWCCNGKPKEVAQCPVEGCELFPFRFGVNPNKKTRLKLKTIRSKCIDCSAGSLKEVNECWDTNCPLFPLRMGRNPNLVGKRRNNIGSLQKLSHQSAILG